METGLEGKPWYFGAGLGVVLAGLLVFGGYKLQFEKMKHSIANNRSQYEQLRKKIDEARAAERSLPQFRETVRRLELELDKLLRILPSRRKTEDLLRRVRSLAEQGDFDLLAFDPQNPQPLDDFYSEWAINIQLSGSYHNLALFFDRISRFSRIINIENVRISPLTTGHHTIDANFTAKTFLYNETEEEL